MNTTEAGRSREEIRTLGRRVEDRREALGVSIDWLCDEAGIRRAHYWPKVLVTRGERFYDDELRRLAQILHAPEGWPEKFRPDPERIAALVIARSAAATLRATAQRATGAPPSLDLPACPHLNVAGPAAWCAYCLAEFLAEAERRAHSRCEHEHGGSLEDALARAEDNAVRLCIAELNGLLEQAQTNADRAKASIQHLMQGKLKVYRICLGALYRVQERKTRLGRAGCADRAAAATADEALAREPDAAANNRDVPEGSA